MYKDKTIEFIIDETDTVHSYEEKGRSSSASRASEPVDVTDALKGMNRVQQIEVVQGEQRIICNWSLLLLFSHSFPPFCSL